MKCVVPSLIGLPKGAPALVEFMRTIRSDPELEHYKGKIIENYSRDGISLHFDQRDRLANVVLFSGCTPKRSRYSGPLPEGLSFEMSRADVKSRFGSPEESDADWEIFTRDRHVFHLQYADSGARVAMIGVQASDREEDSPSTSEARRPMKGWYRLWIFSSLLLGVLIAVITGIKVLDVQPWNPENTPYFYLQKVSPAALAGMKRDAEELARHERDQIMTEGFVWWIAISGATLVLSHGVAWVIRGFKLKKPS